jgi:hypothetical protein
MKGVVMRIREKYMPVSVRDRERATFKPTGCGREGHVGNHGDAGTSWCETCRALAAEACAKRIEADRDTAISHLRDMLKMADEQDWYNDKVLDAVRAWLSELGTEGIVPPVCFVQAEVKITPTKAKEE